MTREMTMEEVQEAGFRALLDALGPADAIRFIWQFDQGRGDYTKERHTWLKDLTVEDFVRGAKKLQRE
jgi:hypothetical protein